MNIVFISDSYLHAVNGIVKQLLLLKKELQKRGHRVIIVAPKPNKKNLTEEKDVLYVPSVTFFMRPQDRLTMPFNRKVEKFLMETPIDIIHCHEGLLAFLGTKISKKKQIPQLVTLHTNIQEYVRWLFPKLSNYTNTITDQLSRLYFNQYNIAIAPSIKAFKVLKKAKVRVPIKLLYNGIDLDFFQNANANAFQEKFNLNPKDPLIVIVGRIDIGKNINVAIHAMKKVLKYLPKTKLAIIGDGNLRKKMEKLIKKSGLGNNVFITGFLDPALVASANHAASLAIMTSDSDTLPTVAIEAIACGKPMVAVQDDAIVAIVENGVNGILTALDPTAVANAIIRILKNNKLREQYAKASLKLSKKFSIKNHVDELEKTYHELIAKNEK